MRVLQLEGALKAKEAERLRAMRDATAAGSSGDVGRLGLHITTSFGRLSHIYLHIYLIILPIPPCLQVARALERAFAAEDALGRLESEVAGLRSRVALMDQVRIRIWIYLDLCA